MIAGEATSRGFGADLDGTTFINRTGPVAQSINTQSIAVSGLSQGSSGTRFGGELTLAGGYNIQLGRSFLTGLQLEGGIFSLNLDQDKKFILSGTQLTTLTNVAANGTATTTTQLLTSTGQATARLKHDPLWRASALFRLGVLMNDNTLLYVAGGPTYFKFDTDLSGKSAGLWAATIGGGVEVRLSPEWSITADYRYHHLTPTSLRTSSSASSASTSSNLTTVGATSSFTSVRTEGNMHSARIGLNRWFN
jgi:opacity protein-like surface antigen